MALVPTTLQTQIQAAFLKAFANKTGTPETMAAMLAADLTLAIDTYIKSAQVNPGQLVVGSGGGVPGPMAGATTTPGNLS